MVWLVPGTEVPAKAGSESIRIGNRWPSRPWVWRKVVDSPAPPQMAMRRPVLCHARNSLAMLFRVLAALRLKDRAASPLPTNSCPMPIINRHDRGRTLGGRNGCALRVPEFRGRDYAQRPGEFRAIPIVEDLTDLGQPVRILRQGEELS